MTRGDKLLWMFAPSSRPSGDTWSIILAGGDGSRLRALTTTLFGESVPKQYCCVWAGASLIEGALARAAQISHATRMCAVVAASHRRWWSTALLPLADGNVMVQPRDLGTGVGVLLALLRIRRRDPHANVVLLPTSHYLRDESTMALALREVTDLAATDPQAMYLLGAESTKADPDLGYIVPGDRSAGVSTVARFVENPSLAELPGLVAQSALVNVSIVAASVSALLGLYTAAHSNAVASIDAALERGGLEARRHLTQAYDRVASIDFSRDLLQHHASLLRVVAVRECGWSDLATPERVAEVLKRPPVRSAPVNRCAAPLTVSMAMHWQEVY